MGDRYQDAVVSGFFYCCMTIAPHAIATHLNGWLGMKHRATHHPVDNPSELCARYHERIVDMVRQDTIRLNRILMGKLVNFVNGLGVMAYHPWGTYG